MHAFCGPLFVEEARDNSKMCRGESDLSITALERGVFVAVRSCFMQSGFLVIESLKNEVVKNRSPVSLTTNQD